MHHATFDNSHFGFEHPNRGTFCLYMFIEHIPAINHTTERHMPTVQPLCRSHENEELRGVSVRCASVGHTKDPSTIVTDGEVLVREPSAVDAFASSAIATHEVAALQELETEIR